MQYNNGVANIASGYNVGTCESSTSTAVLYTGGPATTCGKMAVMYRGYIFASLAGTYTFSSISVDDGAFYWVGANAKSGWTTANAAMKPVYNAAGLTTTFTAPIEGTYIPYRIILINNQAGINGGGGSGYAMTVKDPYGVQIDIGAGSLNVAQYSCDGSSGPRFVGDMGKEV